MVAKGGQFYSTHKVQEIVDGQTIKLEDGPLIRLSGIDLLDGERAKQVLDTLIGKNHVIVILEKPSDADFKKYLQEAIPASVYVWGINRSQLPSSIDPNKLEYRGFLNVKSGKIDSYEKGVGLFLNASLIKLGLAKQIK